MIAGIKALVVEDVAIAQKIAEVTLAALDCNVDVAKNGESALSLFKQNSYDIVFMDLGLPDMDGVEVTQKIREIETDEKRVPIIALTASLNGTGKPTSATTGINEFLLKPLVKESCKAVIERFITKNDC
jgi:two-component system, OmpR family, aerobic respiration control sensor histidine kinase ArcB